MEAVAGLHGVYCDQVFFSEDPGPTFRISDRRVNVRIPGQNANLRQVKERLARVVVKKGGNALVGFRYGQKTNFLGWDKGNWYGEGYIARLPGAA